MPTFNYLTGPQVADVVSMAEAIEAVRRAYEALSAGSAHAPVRTSVQLPDGGTTLSMLASLPEQGVTTVKVVSVFPDNPSRGLPTVLGLVSVYDSSTGAPLAVMEAGTLTAIRTGAASGVATDLLARPDADTLALIGTGNQAPHQAEAVATVRLLRIVRVYSRSEERREAFARELQSRFREWDQEVEVLAAPSAAEAVRDAGIICTATTSSTPVFSHSDVSPGTHVNGVGSFTLNMREVPAEFVRAARVVVDSREAARAEAGDLLPLVDERTVRWEDLSEIGEVLLGRRPGRQSPEDITFFKSVGLAVQDAAVGALVAAKIRTGEIGQRLELHELGTER